MIVRDDDLAGLDELGLGELGRTPRWLRRLRKPVKMLAAAALTGGAGFLASQVLQAAQPQAAAQAFFPPPPPPSPPPPRQFAPAVAAAPTPKPEWMQTGFQTASNLARSGGRVTETALRTAMVNAGAPLADARMAAADAARRAGLKGLPSWAIPAGIGAVALVAVLIARK